MPYLKDLLTLNAMKNINSLMISLYRNAYVYAIEIELDTPSDLIEHILEWEISTSKALSRIMIEELNCHNATA